MFPVTGRHSPSELGAAAASDTSLSQPQETKEHKELQAVTRSFEHFCTSETSIKDLPSRELGVSVVPSIGEVLERLDTSPMIMNRARGGLLGLALGDALGTTNEFIPRHSRRLKKLTAIVGGGNFKLPKGCFTDDTSMALALADSLITYGGHNAHHQMDCYRKWLEQGKYSPVGYCVDKGLTVANALEKYKRDLENPYQGSTDAKKAGNGSLMRLLPVVLFYGPNKTDTPELAIKYAEKSSKTTHGAMAAIEACKVFAWLLYYALAGTFLSKQALLDECAKYFAGKITDKALYDVIVKQSYIAKSEDAIKGTGYVVQSIEAALWCFYHTDNFKDSVLAAAHLGDDADTTAAICGQIAGVFYGYDELPIGGWLAVLLWRNEIDQYAKRLVVTPIKIA